MSAGGVRNEPTAGGGTGNSPFTSPGSDPVMRTADFRDSNGNGIDDRDEGGRQFQGFSPVDRSMGFGRQFQQPSFINPFMGAYGFGQPFGGFNNPYGGFGGGFGMGIGGLYGGYNPMPYGGYQSYQPPQQFPGNAYAPPMMGGGISPFFGGGYY